MKLLLKLRVAAVAGNEHIPVDKRIEKLLAMRKPEDEDEDDDKYPSRNIIIYDAMTRMLEKCNHPELPYAYALLIEAYDNCYKSRPIGPLAEKIIDILKYGDLPITPEQKINILDRVSAALEDSYYLYTNLEVLDFLFAIARENEVDDELLKKAAVRYIRAYTLAADRNGLPKEIPADIRRLVSDKKLMEIVARPDKGHLKHDPVEYTREWADAAYDVEDELDRRFANIPRHMGFCFRYWPAKQELLLKKYGIEWRTPAQMNPRVHFD